MSRLPLLSSAVVLVAVTVTAAGARPARAHSAATRAPSAPTRVQAPDGKAIYLKSCKQCHGVLGEPTKTAQREYEKIPSFKDAAFFEKKKDAELAEAVAKGKGKMKPFAEKLTAAEIDAVVQYIHTLHKP